MRKRSLICGVGLNDYFGEIVVGNVRLAEYDIWRRMIRRCYSEEFLCTFPTYRGAFVEDYLLSLQNFYNFSKTVVNFNKDGWDMDKDILGRRIGVHGYTRETLVYVPKEINYLILDNGAIRGEYPIGVCFDKQTGRYKSTLKKFGKTFNLGRFDTVDEAYEVYCKEKSKHIIHVAEKYKGVVDDRVYDSLVDFHSVKLLEPFKNEVYK